jgi:hypothetical protein
MQLHSLVLFIALFYKIYVQSTQTGVSYFLHFEKGGKLDIMA